MFWQLTKQAMERNADKRTEYLYRIGLLYQPGQLVFVDESSCDRRTTYRNNAWAIRGQRAFRKAFFVRGQRYCFIISYLPTGNSFHIDTLFFLPSHSMAFSVLIYSFAQFINGLLDRMKPFPAKNSVIVMDNCRIHHADFILKMIIDRYVAILRLDPNIRILKFK
jgi:hypothetical protein